MRNLIDPPRIEIRGYTHNLNSEVVNNETNGKSKSVPITPEPQFHQKNVTSSDESEFLPNGAVPTSTNSSSSKRDFDDTNCSSHTKQQKKPNVKTKTKSKHKYCKCSLLP